VWWQTGSEWHSLSSTRQSYHFLSSACQWYSAFLSYAVPSNLIWHLNRMWVWHMPFITAITSDIITFRWWVVLYHFLSYSLIKSHSHPMGHSLWVIICFHQWNSLFTSCLITTSMSVVLQFFPVWKSHFILSPKRVWATLLPFWSLIIHTMLWPTVCKWHHSCAFHKHLTLHLWP